MTLELDEPAARRLLLVQAVEAADANGRILAPAERERLEEDAWRAAPQPQPYLHERARRILEVLAPREPALAAVQQAQAWQPALGWLLPLVAFCFGAALDRIGNPQHVNMLSPPLLLFLAWNIGVYVALAAAPLLQRRRDAASPSAGLLGKWLRDVQERAPQRVRSNLRAAVLARFRALWWNTAGALETWRLQQLLHASAAAWAVGVAVSIGIGGLVREYRVGWESTLLDLPQVHAFLRVVFAPVVALLPVEGFSVADLERMHFRSGVQVARAEARHWVGLYIGLLFIVVVLPRLALAAHARWRARRLASRLVVDLRDPYYVAVLSRVGVRRLAQFLVEAARDSQEVKSTPFSLKRWVVPGERDANLQAREEAMALLLQRVQDGLRRTLEEMARLNGREVPAAISAALSRDFIHHDPVDAPQAGVAGAAAGVAAGALAGAKVDVLSGGMTLGAATLLGALIGGTGALTAAHWRNRTTPQGKAMVQLGDEMLDALVREAMAAYAATSHVLPDAWRETVSVDAERYAPLWARARADAAGVAAELAELLQGDLDRFTGGLPGR